jgi:hypothetical protein
VSAPHHPVLRGISRNLTEHARKRDDRGFRLNGRPMCGAKCMRTVDDPGVTCVRCRRLLSLEPQTSLALDRKDPRS